MDAGDLTSIRADLETLLPDTCTILSVTRASDGQGGWTDTWGTTTASVVCRLDARSGRELPTSDRLYGFQGYVLTLPYGTAITTAHRVSMGGVAYNVTAVDAGKSWSACVRAILEKV